MCQQTLYHQFICGWPTPRVSDDSGIVFLQKGDPLPMMVFGAREAFGQMPKHELKTLTGELDVHPATPDLLGTLEILIATIIPDATQAEVRTILEKRCHVHEDPLSDLVDDAQIEELLPKGAVKVVQDSLNCEMCRGCS